MSIKIEFNAETPAKAHEEMVEFARLFLGTPVTEARKPYVPTERVPVIQETTNTVIPLEVAPEASEEVEDTKPPVKEEKKRTTTAKKTTKTAPAAKEETPVVPVETKEETPADTNDGAETGSDAGSATPNNYGPGFEDCSNDVEVMTKVRALVNTFNLKGRPNANFAKKVFASYGVATMLKLSTEQAIEMYGRLINATEEDINQE